MGKKLLGGLAAVGLALAGAAVKKIFSEGLDALGWVGIAIGLGILGLVVVAALAGKQSEPPEPTPESPSPPVAPTP